MQDTSTSFILENYYQKFNLKPNDAGWRALRKIEKIARSREIDADESVAVIIAIKIFSSSQLKKYYDLHLKNPRFENRAILYLRKIAFQKSLVIVDEKLTVIFSEKNFFLQKLWIIIQRSLGFDFILDGLGFINQSGRVERLGHRTAFSAFMAHTLLFYIIPISFISYDKKYWPLFFPFWFWNLYREYKFAKLEYYEEAISGLEGLKV